MPEKLKAVLSSLEGLDKALQPFYEEQADGSFVLAADVESHPTVAGLRNALKGRPATRDLLEKYKAFGSPEELAARLADLEAEPTGGKKDTTAAKLKELEAKLAAKDARTKQLEENAAKSVARTAATEAIAALRGSSKLLLDPVLKQVRVIEEDGEFVTVVVDHKGEPRLDGNGDRVTLKDVIAAMKKDPDYAPAFEGTGAGGSGRQGNDGRPTGGKVIAMGDEKAFLANLDGIAKGTVHVQ